MNQTSATEAVVIGIFLVAVVFTWDGLVRRHIRLSRALLQWQVNIRGCSPTPPGEPTARGREQTAWRRAR